MTEYVKLFLAVGVIIEQNGRYLLVKEAGGVDRPEIRGLWNNPSGRLELGDSIAETAIREAKEETGLIVELLYKIGLFYKEGEQACKYFFKAKIVNGEINFPKSEILDVRWFAYNEVIELAKNNQLRSRTIVEAIEKIEREE